MYTISQIKELIQGDFLQFYQDDDIQHFSYDSRSVKNGNKTLFFALQGNNRDGHQYLESLIEKGVKNFVVTKNIQIDSVNIIKVENALEALQLLAKKHRAQFNIPVIGIAGSHGKTIVKEWLYQLLHHDFNICRSPKSFNSQIGVPISVLQLTNTNTLAIFEAGISKPNEMDTLEKIIQPTIGVFTGIGAAHDSGFNSREEKQKEKFRLFKNTKIVLDKNSINGNYNIPFQDKSSIENCKTCIAVLEYLNYTESDIQEKINHLNPIALRMEMRDGKNGNTILNDTYNISFESLSIALNYLNEQAGNKTKLLIISDIPEYDYSSLELENLIKSIANLAVYTIGKHQLKLDNDYNHFSSILELKDYLTHHPIQNQSILLKGSREFKLEEIALLLEEKKHQTTLTINLHQLERNLSYFKSKLNKETKLMVMVKAFAYGSGTTEIPKFLQHHKVDYLGVAYTDEGVKLREEGIHLPIIVMNPEPESYSQLIEHNLEPNIYSLNILDEFIRTLITHQKKDYPIHLKIDTGMNRLGIKPMDLPKAIELIKTQPEVYIKSVFSHLSSADVETEKTFTLNQIEQFKQAKNLIEEQIPYPKIYHILNTAGIENYPENQFDMVRLGVGLYGIQTAFKNDNEIKPIATLKSAIIQIKKIENGDSVGYSRKFIANKPMIIGIVPVGYADGIRRALGNGNYAFYVNGKLAKTVGNICMDTCMIDLTNIRAQEGDEIEIFGPNLPIEELAKKMETIPYEVMTSISQRVKRVFIRE